MHKNPWGDLYSREISIRKVICQQIKYDINEKPLKTHKNRYITRKTDYIDPELLPRRSQGGYEGSILSVFHSYITVFASF